jgi:hypothetical protein
LLVGIDRLGSLWRLFSILSNIFNRAFHGIEVKGVKPFEAMIRRLVKLDFDGDHHSLVHA